MVASEAFERVDKYVYQKIWAILKHKHPKKSRKWLSKNYWTAAGKKGIFRAIKRYKNKGKRYLLIKVSSIKIKRHKKIKAEANPYQPEYARYFWIRRHDKEAKFLRELSARKMRLAN